MRGVGLGYLHLEFAVQSVNDGNGSFGGGFPTLAISESRAPDFWLAPLRHASSLIAGGCNRSHFPFPSHSWCARTFPIQRSRTAKISPKAPMILLNKKNPSTPFSPVAPLDGTYLIVEYKTSPPTVHTACATVQSF